MTFFFLSFDFVTVFTFISYMSATFVMELKELGILLNEEIIKILLSHLKLLFSDKNKSCCTKSGLKSNMI